MDVSKSLSCKQRLYELIVHAYINKYEINELSVHEHISKLGKFQDQHGKHISI